MRENQKPHDWIICRLNLNWILTKSDQRSCPERNRGKMEFRTGLALLVTTRVTARGPDHWFLFPRRPPGCLEPKL